MKNKRVLVAPSILAADFSQLRVDVCLAEHAGADMLHLDIMDGHFVDNISFGPDISKIAISGSKLPAEAHLMVREPLKWAKKFKEIGCEYITFHDEAVRKSPKSSPNLEDAIRVAEEIRKEGAKVGISYNPDNDLSTLPGIIRYIDLVLIMTVYPGRAGQKFLEEGFLNLKKAASIRDKESPRVLLAVDGGINLDTAPKVIAAGADILVMGSAFFEADDYADIIRKIKAI
ncbi:ribulose-phosphate 3-epimerase [bacterium]|nr:MAG: ribulose-phosphate 3-epimerase [bacterium]